MTDSCTCPKCVKACHGNPGWFLPGEAEKAAELVGHSFSRFSKLLIKDHASSPFAPDAPYVWAPRKIFQEGEAERFEEPPIRDFSDQRARGRCVFLMDDSRCAIHAAKPFECRKFFGCTADRTNYRDYIEQKWVEAGAPLGYRPEEND